MQNHPKISIIIPVYKTKEKHLVQVLESVLNQSLKDFEIIIVSDGPDNCNKTCEKFQKNDSRISLIYNINKGLGGARNVGIRAALGEYIIFIDGDDWIVEDTLEQAYKNLKENNCDVLFFDVKSFDEKTKQIGPLNAFATFPKELSEKIFDYKDPFMFNNLFNICHTAWAKIFRKDFLVENDLWFLEECVFEDLEFFFRYIFKTSRLCYLNSALYFYRINVESSLVNKANKKHFDILKVYSSIENSLKKNNLFEEQKIHFYNRKFGSISYRYKNVENKYKKAFKKLINADFKNINFKKSDYENLSNYSKIVYNDFLGTKKHHTFIFIKKVYIYYLLYYSL